MDDEDLLLTSALRVVRSIQREGPLTQRRFTEVSRHDPKYAKTLRERMQKAGWIQVREEVNVMDITLTSKGRKLAELSFQMDEIARK